MSVGLVRRLPEGYAKLPPDHGGLELHRETLPTAQGNHRRSLEIPGGADGKLTGITEGRVVAALSRHVWSRSR
jgi:hypothetical protein